jgi:type I restriction enzyme S subunit
VVSLTKWKETVIGKIPKDWDLKNAEDFCTRVTDGTHDSPKKREKGKHLITSKHLKNGHLDFDNSYLISAEDFIKVNRRSKVDQWDVILSMIGTLGNVYLERSSKIDYAIKNVGLFKTGSETKGKWLYFYFQSKDAKNYISASRGGTTQEYITLEALRKFPIPFPQTTKEVELIIGILDSLDQKIELNNQMNKTLENIAQVIFKRWFIDFEFPNENGEPYKSSGGEMVESELGIIPKGWGVSTIGKSLQTFLGGTPSTKNKNYWTNGSIPWINSGKVNEFRILEPTAYITEEALKNSATKIMPKKTTVIAITGATLGKVSIIEKEMCANQSVVGIIENKILPSEFIYFWIKAHMKKLMSEQTGGAQQHINKENVNSLEILIPPLQIIEKYIINVRPIFDEISNKCFENLTLSKIRDDLLPKLMTGKIRVPMEGKNVE